jgi:hypothetical protein
MFLLFSFLESMKKPKLYLPIFQWGAGGSQAGAAKLVQSWRCRALQMCLMRSFRGIVLRGAVERCEMKLTVFVKIIGKTALDAEFRSFQSRGLAESRFSQSFSACSET